MRDVAQLAQQLLTSMESVVVSGVELNRDHGRITIREVPDQPGNCARIFNAVAASGIVVDMIVQNLTGTASAELSFSVPQSDLEAARLRARNVVQAIDVNATVFGEDDSVVLFVFGVGMRTHTGVAEKMFGALANSGINIRIINTSEICISVVVDAAQDEAALTALRHCFALDQ